MRRGRASSTALLIARSTVVSSGDPARRALYDRSAIELCSAFLRDHQMFGNARLWLYRRAWYRKALGWIEHLTLPGIQLHYALRKKKIEEVIRAGLLESFGEVQVIGAGFDTLACRLAREFGGVRFVELDHPATQKSKVESLGRIEGARGLLSFRSVDLERAESMDVLEAEGGHVAVSTMVVAEGVLMYLDEAAVQHFFTSLRRKRRGKLRTVFTFMAPDRHGRIRFHNSSRLVGLWLRVKGEPFKWGIAPAALEGFLADLGYRLTGLHGHEELHARYLAGGPAERLDLAVGEWLAVAEAVR